MQLIRVDQSTCSQETCDQGYPHDEKEHAVDAIEADYSDLRDSTLRFVTGRIEELD